MSQEERGERRATDHSHLYAQRFEFGPVRVTDCKFPAQMITAMPIARALLKDVRPPISDDAIADSLWHYWFDVDKAVTWLRKDWEKKGQWLCPVHLFHSFESLLRSPVVPCGPLPECPSTRIPLRFVLRSRVSLSARMVCVLLQEGVIVGPVANVQCRLRLRTPAEPASRRISITSGPYPTYTRPITSTPPCQTTTAPRETDGAGVVAPTTPVRLTASINSEERSRSRSIPLTRGRFVLSCWWQHVFTYTSNGCHTPWRRLSIGGSKAHVQARASRSEAQGGCPNRLDLSGVLGIAIRITLSRCHPSSFRLITRRRWTLFRRLACKAPVQACTEDGSGTSRKGRSGHSSRGGPGSRGYWSSFERRLDADRQRSTRTDGRRSHHLALPHKHSPSGCPPRCPRPSSRAIPLLLPPHFHERIAQIITPSGVRFRPNTTPPIRQGSGRPRAAGPRGIWSSGQSGRYRPAGEARSGGYRDAFHDGHDGRRWREGQGGRVVGGVVRSPGGRRGAGTTA
jgi:hypothetical protein